MFIARLVKALTHAKINYVIVGGYAVALHGAVRGTVDIDIVICLSKKDFITTEKALHTIGLESRLPVTGEQVFNFREDYIRNRNLIAWNFFNPKNPIEIVDIIITHDYDQMKPIQYSIDGLIYSVASISDLIQMKEHTGRLQDQADIEALKKIRSTVSKQGKKS